MTKKQKGRIGPLFDDFLKEDGIYEEVTARAIKRVLARQLDALMEDQGLSKSALAKKSCSYRGRISDFGRDRHRTGLGSHQDRPQRNRSDHGV